MGALAQPTLSSVTPFIDLAPLATAAPVLLEEPARLSRRFRGDDGIETAICGYYSLSNAFMTHECPGGDCTTSGTFYGCDQWFFTTCWNMNDGICVTGRDKLQSLDLCCTNTDWPNCATASKRVDGKWLTNFECWADPISGEYVAVDKTTTDPEPEPTTSTSSTSKSTTNKTSSSQAAPNEPSTLSKEDEGDKETSTNAESSTSAEETRTSTESGQDTSLSVAGQETTSSSSSNTGASVSESTSTESSNAGSSESHVGAIVGGVIGGLALLAAVGFGIWFMRSYTRKERAAKGEMGGAHQLHGDSMYPNDRTAWVKLEDTKYAHAVEAPTDSYPRAELPS